MAYRMPSLIPPFTHETAIAKVRLAEDGWNSRDPSVFRSSTRKTASGGTGLNFRLDALKSLNSSNAIGLGSLIIV